MKKNNPNYYHLTINKYSSFTLIELIVVLAIISILVTILIATIKPTEIFKKSRDSKRIADLKNIEKIIDLLYSTYPNFNELNYASTNIVYISLKDTSATCANWINDLPPLPSGYEYRCSANPQNIDGTGWIPIPFNSFDIINIANLPIDPINKPPYYYTFVVGGSYEITAKLENIPKTKSHSLANDDGDHPLILEAGSNKKLTPNEVQGRGATYEQLTYSDPSLVGYWSFDEGSGTTAYDYSGNNNHGTLYNGPQWVDGKVGKALRFDGVDDYVKANANGVSSGSNPRSILIWINPATNTNLWGIVGYGSGNCTGKQFYIGRQSGNRFTFWGGCADYHFPSDYVYSNEWSFLVITFDGVLVRGYKNGLLKGKVSKPINTPNISKIIIGAESTTDGNSFRGYFPGLIDEVRIYNRALSNEEIKALYEATR